MKKVYRILFWCMATVVFMNSILLHYASEKIKTLEANKASLKIDLYNELNNIAWDSTVSINRQHVLGITRYYDCDAVKTKIETYLNEQDYETKYNIRGSVAYPNHRRN